MTAEFDQLAGMRSGLESLEVGATSPDHSVTGVPVEELRGARVPAPAARRLGAAVRPARRPARR